MCDGTSSRSAIVAMVCTRRTVSTPSTVCRRCERHCPSCGHSDRTTKNSFRCHRLLVITAITTIKDKSMVLRIHTRMVVCTCFGCANFQRVRYRQYKTKKNVINSKQGNPTNFPSPILEINDTRSTKIKCIFI